MLTVHKHISDNDLIETLVSRWIEALALGAFDEACNLLFENDDWVNPSTIEALVSNYGQLEEPIRVGPHRVTRPSTAIGTPYHSIERRKWETADGVVGDAFIELPLDGEWSSLSAIFIIYSIEGHLAFKLERVEVP